MDIPDSEAVDIYNEVTLAMRWHQPLEYIRNLSQQDYLNVAQVLDADYKIMRSPLRKRG